MSKAYNSLNSNPEVIKECIKAYKAGTRFLRTDGEEVIKTKGSLRFLEEEAGSPEIGADYSTFSISECSYEKENEMVHIIANLLLPTCISIGAYAAMVNIETEELVVQFGQQLSEDKQSLVYVADEKIKIEDSKLDKLIVIVHAYWLRNEKEQIHRAAVLSNLKDLLEVDYEHIYPKMEEFYVKFPKDSSVSVMAEEKKLSSDILKKNKRAEAGKINIALFRKPDDAKDLDYLCEFGKDEFGRPFLGIPAEGKLTFKSNYGENGIDIISAEATCMVKEEGSELGFRVVASSLEPIKHKIDVDITGSVVHYKYTDSWGEGFCYGGEWKKHIFDYYLSVVVTYKYSGEEQKATYIIGTLKPEVPLMYIPQIMIMWGCVWDNTFIEMADGRNVKIGEVRIGDLVQCEEGYAMVANTWRGRESEYILVSAGGRELRLTLDHPVSTTNGWKRAKDLCIGEQIRTGTGESIEIDSVKLVKETISTCNLSFFEEKSNTMIAEGFIIGNMEAQNSNLC